MHLYPWFCTHPNKQNMFIINSGKSDNEKTTWAQTTLILVTSYLFKVNLNAQNDWKKFR